jgi:O-antigen/teichoic acid export membrane protein
LLSSLKSSAERFLPKGGFARKVGLLASGTAAAQLITVLILPLLTRLFTPEQFGVLASYVAIIAIVNTISGLRYEMAIPLAANEEQAFHLLVLSILLVFAIAVITTTVVALIPDHVLPLGGVKWLIPLGIIAVGVYQALSYWALREKAYKELAQTKFSQGIGRAVTQIGAGLLGAGAPGLVVGEVVGQSAGIMRLGWRDMDRFRRYGGQTTRGNLRATARMYRDFPLLVSPASLLNSAGLQAPTLLIAAFYGPIVAGWYFAAHRIVALPVQMIARAVGDAFFAEAPEIARKNPAELQKMFATVARNLLLVGILPAILIILMAPWLLPWLLGSEWRMSGTFLQLLSAAFLFALAYSPINFAIIGRNDYSLLWAAFRLLATTGAVTAPFVVGLPAVASIAMLSAAMAVSYLVERVLWERGVSDFVAVERDKAASAS